jgi:probable rRNA maturation factor
MASQWIHTFSGPSTTSTMSTTISGSAVSGDADQGADAGMGGENDPPPDEPGPSRSERANFDVIDISASPAARGCSGDVMRWLGAQLARAASEVGRPISRIAVRIVDDAEMIDLHGRHMDDPTTTDVLTFPTEHEDGTGDCPGAIDVDIAVCVDEARRQAERRGHALRRELLLYAIHGVLHCAGYDDVDEADERAMHAREDEILRLIGVGETYCGDGEAEGAS